MRRREFLTLFGGAAAAWPFAAAAPAGAQQPRPLVAFIGAASRQESYERAFVAGLRDLGFTRGRDVDVEFYWTASTVAAVPGIVAGLTERRVAVIATGGGNVARAAHELAPRVPIVFVADPDPVANGLVASLARPGGNITGFSLQSADLAAKWIEVLRELLPRLARIAVIYGTVSRTTSRGHTQIVAAAGSIGATIKDHGVASAEELDRAFADAADSADAAIVLRDFIIESNRARIVALAARHRLPVVYEQSEYVRVGGLVSYGAELADMHRRAAGYVVRVLRGASPADLPVEQPVRFEFVLNLRTAQTLGLTPSAALLAYADEVIE